MSSQCPWSRYPSKSTLSSDQFKLESLHINPCSTFFFRDIRSTEANADRVKTFNTRVESYYKSFQNSFTAKNLDDKPYLHYLRNHVGNTMKFALDYFGWGYGYFTCNAGEHLNKVVKTMQLTATNMDDFHLQRIIRNLRILQFDYTRSIIPREVKVRCSRCNEVGHNRKNKQCPLHEIHLPQVVFSDSEDES